MRFQPRHIFTIFKMSFGPALCRQGHLYGSPPHHTIPPVSTSQSKSVISQEPVTTHLLSLDTANVVIAPLWPVNQAVCFRRCHYVLVQYCIFFYWVHNVYCNTLDVNSWSFFFETFSNSLNYRNRIKKKMKLRKNIKWDIFLLNNDWFKLCPEF